MKCLVEAPRMDRVSHEEVCKRAGMKGSYRVESIETVRACGVPYGQKGVDGRSGEQVQGRPMLGWIDGGLGQQRNDGGDCATIDER